MQKKLGKIQIGKQGITDNFIESLKDVFKTHENIKIHLLKSAGHNKEKVQEYKREILKSLGEKYTAKVIGFTIVLKKWRKPRKI